MKKLLYTFTLCLLAIAAIAQSPHGINYQAVVRDASGNQLSNQAVSLRITILENNTTTVYQETHAVTTNGFGLVNLVIGQGSAIQGVFSSIGWSTGSYFVQLETDVTGGSNYLVMGSQQLMSVPYALYAETSGQPGIQGPTGPQGPAGADGAAGPVGTDGATGPTGPQGVQGAAGAQGPTGPTGADGLQGPQGMMGPIGPQGSTGPTGPQGLQGVQGVTGPQGLSGVQGSTGAQGPTGAQGIPGNDGATGTSGPQGPTGAQGPQGITGPTGPQGVQGPTGAQGLQGVQGVTGPQGIQGATGLQGSTGAQGIQGVPGVTGPQGLTGPTGAQGPTGTFGVSGVLGQTIYHNGIDWDATSNLYNDGSNIQTNSDVIINGLTVGRGSGNDSTNTALGYQALSSNASAGNSAFGYDALRVNVNGVNNTASGIEALVSNTSGGHNVANGKQALRGNTTGSFNTANGYTALFSNTTGINNTATGYSANSMGSIYTNSTGIGYNADNTASNSVRLGNAAVSSIGGQVGWTTLSDGRFKTNVRTDEVKGLEFIMGLEPLTYTYDIDEQAAWKERNYGEKDTAQWEGKYDIEQLRFSGFIAQDVEQLAKKVGYNFSGVDVPKNDKDVYGIRYAEFVVPLVKAVQEQQELIEKLLEEVKTLKQENKEIRLRKQLLNLLNFRGLVIRYCESGLLNAVNGNWLMVTG